MTVAGVTPLRVGFAGTPEFAAQALEALHHAGCTLVLVLTQPDRPAGRGLKMQPSAVKRQAQALGLPVIQPRSLRLDGRWPDDALAARDALAAAQLDVLVVAAYGLILPAWVLAVPRQGCINIHASLLPRWRGAAPIQRAIEAGDARTGITIMQMDEGLDTGDMLMVAEEPIGPEDTAATLHDRLAASGAQLIVRALQDVAQARLTPQRQPEEGVTYAHKIEKGEAPIDWQLPADVIERRIRAFDPFPGASTQMAGESVKLWRARMNPAPIDPTALPGTILAVSPQALTVATGHGALDLLEFQLAGGRRVALGPFMQTAVARSLRPGSALPG